MKGGDGRETPGQHYEHETTSLRHCRPKTIEYRPVIAPSYRNYPTKACASQTDASQSEGTDEGPFNFVHYAAEGQCPSGYLRPRLETPKSGPGLQSCKEPAGPSMQTGRDLSRLDQGRREARLRRESSEDRTPESSS